jgi:3-hydroxyacyl-[acyl-carrier-protein] dehydratase
VEAVYDIRKIMALLPHRYPFILVDRIVEMTPHERIVGLKNVTMNEPFFQGHFPASPVMPGVLIVEAMAQAGGILAYASRGEDEEKELVYFMGIDKARFRKPVIPGDQLILEMVSTKTRGNVFKMSGKASVDGAMVAEADIMAMTGEKA